MNIRHLRPRISYFALGLLLCGHPLVFAASVAADEAAVKVLFIGNSQTSRNDVPSLVEQLSSAGKGPHVATKTITRGGETLTRHVERDDPAAPLRVIAEGGWDIVVIQEHGGHMVALGRSTIAAASRLVQAARKAGARPVLYMTWSRKSQPERQARISAAYRELSARLDVEVAPAGEAFRTVRAAHAAIELYDRDDIHASPAGSYLAACVIYKTLFGTDLEDLPADSAPGNMRLSAETTAALRRVAQLTVGG